MCAAIQTEARAVGHLLKQNQHHQRPGGTKPHRAQLLCCYKWRRRSSSWEARRPFAKTAKKKKLTFSRTCSAIVPRMVSGYESTSPRERCKGFFTLCASCQHSTVSCKPGAVAVNSSFSFPATLRNPMALPSTVTPLWRLHPRSP